MSGPSSSSFDDDEQGEEERKAREADRHFVAAHRCPSVRRPVRRFDGRRALSRPSVGRDLIDSGGAHCPFSTLVSVPRRRSSIDIVGGPPRFQSRPPPPPPSSPGSSSTPILACARTAIAVRGSPIVASRLPPPLGCCTERIRLDRATVHRGCVEPCSDGGSSSSRRRRVDADILRWESFPQPRTRTIESI